jgi:uncharacterized protein YdaU (DUF1376 family)
LEGFAALNHYPFNPSDYMMATAHLEPLHDLCYRRCLDLYYDSEAPLTLDKRTLSKRLRVNEDVLSEVLAEFFFEDADGWHHARCDKEIARYQAKSEKAKFAGSLGGKAKKPNKQANAKRTLSECQANASNQNQNQNQNQNHKPNKEESLPLPFVSEEFKTSWQKWLKYREEIKKPLTPTMIESQFGQFAKIGEKRSIDMIEVTIRKGWQGLREESEQGSSSYSKPRHAAYDAATATLGLTAKQIGEF